MTTRPCEVFDACESRRPVRAFRFRIRTLMLVVLVLALSLNPSTAPPVLFMVGAVALGVGALLAAVALGALGFGLVAAATLAVQTLRRVAGWPEARETLGNADDG